MEAIHVPSSPDQSISPYKQIRNPKKNTRLFISRPYENIHGGHLHAPPPSLSFSFPPSASPFNPLHHHHNHQLQPPLLPLPISKPYQSLPSRSRGLSCPPTNRKINRTRDQSLTPKKSKPFIGPKRSDSKYDLRSITTTSTKAISERSVVRSTEPLGPDPNDLPKHVSRVLSSSSSLGNNFGNIMTMEDLQMFSGSVYSLSPPPSSLPLPTFSIRPKLRCNAEAAGIDAGATDNLRRLLRLR